MINKIRDFIRENGMIMPGDTVVCGFSGGADSTALLLSMYELREELRFEVEALHVNHCLRGEESDRDERFCRELCKRYAIPFTALSCDVASYAKEHALSVEEAARVLRYEMFSRSSNGKKIATAHNANDNLETFILNTVRGTALKGLAGIPPIRDNIIRPLLSVSRSEIEDFLASRGQDFVTDSTNLTDEHTRNKIRHNIIPMLQELNPSVVETSVRSINALRTENAFIESEAENAMRQCRTGSRLNGIADYPAAVVRRCIARLLSENDLPYSYDRINSACEILKNDGKINVAGNMYLVSENGSIELTEIMPKKEHENIAKPLLIGENSIYPGVVFDCRMIKCDDLKKFKAVHKKLTYYLLDYDKIKGRAVLRNRRYGDKIQLPGRNFSSSVKKLINETVPRELRGSLHFIDDDDGTVFAECIGVAERVIPDENTRRLLKISVGR